MLASKKDKVCCISVIMWLSCDCGWGSWLLCNSLWLSHLPCDCQMLWCSSHDGHVIVMWSRVMSCNSLWLSRLSKYRDAIVTWLSCDLVCCVCVGLGAVSGPQLQVSAQGHIHPVAVSRQQGHSRDLRPQGQKWRGRKAGEDKLLTMRWSLSVTLCGSYR